ncbi:MAG: molybdopterin molybdotransferase MoeA [Steroidobacteraceae bacterium]
MIAPGQADELIGRHLTCLPTVSLPLLQCAGAVLREDIQAERDQPPFDRVTMDGIALDSAAVSRGTRRFAVQASQAAGDAPLTLASGQACIEVMTGTPLPAGCDCVVPVEQITLADGIASLREGLEVRPGQNVHRRGTDARQGALLLTAGMRLGPPQIAVAAAAGKARVQVASQPMLAVISTGNELIEPGEPILAHQVRRSNAYAIAAALRLHGYQRIATEHIRDDTAELHARLKFHLETHDVLVLSGGVSMGRLDLVPQVLDALGVRCVFHKVAQRPGKPLWFGVAPTGAAVLALPGNPVSTAVCVSRYVLPALAAAQGHTPAPPERIALGEPFTVTTALSFFLPVRLLTDEQGCCRAMPRPTQGSGDFTSLVGTDGFVELPPGPNTYPAGFVAPLYRW